MKTILTLLVPALAISMVGDRTLAAPAAKPKAAAPAAAKSPTDPGWPREITRGGVKVTLYQPQIDEWKNYRELKARAAFVLTAADGKPIVGVMEVAGQTTADAEKRTVFIRDLKITDARFPALPDTEVPPMRELLEKTFPAHSLTVSLDRLSAGLERTKEATKTAALKFDPPKIFVNTRPSMLLLVEGPPVKAPIAGTKLEFVVNTNWDLFFDPLSEAYFVLNDKVWLTATKLDGEWTIAASLPKDFAKLPKGDQWDHVKKVVPPKVVKGMTVPKIFYSEEPAELIAFDGNAVWEDVAGTGLIWGKNTESWVFQDTKQQQIYYLTSGRWFRAPKWEGPWTFASGELPEGFSKIPSDSACADVLASVPGTPEAADAVLLAEVPQEAVVKRKEAEAKAKVAYDGEPAFQPIEGTPVTYATNTSSDVVRVADKYYLCQDAVWFFATAPTGPWSICVDVPEVIYTIPPSYPVYRVTYVRVEPGETDDVVVCSYTGGYFGSFVAGVATGAALVWGTGWYYPPYIARIGAIPIYRPWPATYGVAAAYNPWTGGYAVGARAYGPYGVAGRAAWYNPVTGNYGRAARVAGPYGARTVAGGYNPRTDTAWATRQGNNGYAQWGASAVRRGDDWVRAGHVATEDGGAARWRGSDGGGRVWKGDDHSGGMARHDGDFYAGRDGNVYRRDDDGNWDKYDNGDWNSVDRKNDRNDARERLNNNSQEKQQLQRPENRPNAAKGGENGARPNVPNRGENTNRPNVPDRPQNTTRPVADGGGQRKNVPSNVNRPGAGGGGQQKVNRDSFENRPATRRAETQPSDDVMNRLGRESSGRNFGERQVQQRQSFQGGGREFGASSGSRSFQGGGGGGGGRGGGRRR